MTESMGGSYKNAESDRNYGVVILDSTDTEFKRSPAQTQSLGHQAGHRNAGTIKSGARKWLGRCIV